MIEKQDEFNGQIKAIFRGGKINKIKWGEEAKKGEGFYSWTEKQQKEFAMELASAMNQAADVMQQERNALKEELRVAKEASENAQTALDIQKAVVLEQLTSSNAMQQDLSQKIQKLQAEIRRRDQTIEDLRR